MFKNRLVLFIAAMIVWALLNWIPDWEHLLVGVFASLFIVFMSTSLFVWRAQILAQPRRYFYFFFLFLPVLIGEWMRGALDAAWRCVYGGLRQTPGIVKVKTELRSDIALTFLANAISLAPGTLCVDVNKEQGAVYVHCVSLHGQEIELATARMIARFESIVKKVFEG